MARRSTANRGQILNERPICALLAGAGQMMNRSGFRGDAVDRIAFAQREIEIAVAIEGHCPGPVQRRGFDRRAVRGRLTLAGTAIGLVHAGGKIDLPNAVVADVADQQLAAGIDGNAVRLAKLGPRRRPNRSAGRAASETIVARLDTYRPSPCPPARVDGRRFSRPRLPGFYSTSGACSVSPSRRPSCFTFVRRRQSTSVI
jgi:hypothetical protein